MVAVWVFLVFTFVWIVMTVAVFHKTRTVPFFHELLNSSKGVLLAAGPRCLIMSLVTPSGPSVFLHFNFLLLIQSLLW